MSIGSVYLQGTSKRVQAMVQWYQEESFETPPTFVMEKRIGKGSFSNVQKVTYQGREWAVKKPINEEGLKLMRGEADILVPLNEEERKANQEYFVQVIAWITLKDESWMLMKLYKGGALFDRVMSAEFPFGLSLESTLTITKQMLEALAFLKDERIIHRDIKLPNIFIEEGDRVKLGDFGFAMKVGDVEKSSQFSGTPNFLSPELLAADDETQSVKYYPYGFFSDMWALGHAMFGAFGRCALFETGAPATWKANLQAQHLRVQESLDSEMRILSSEKGLQSSNDLALFQTLLKGMLRLDPEERLSPEAGVDLLSKEGLLKRIAISSL